MRPFRVGQHVQVVSGQHVGATAVVTDFIGFERVGIYYDEPQTMMNVWGNEIKVRCVGAHESTLTATSGQLDLFGLDAR